MTNKDITLVDALNTLVLKATWWLTFLHITWIVGYLVDLGSDFALGSYYNSIGEVGWCYWTIGFAMVASLLNVFVTLAGIRQVPMECTDESKMTFRNVYRRRRLVRFAVLTGSLLLCGPVVMYVIFMIDLYNHDFIDHELEIALIRTNQIQCIIDLLVEQVPQTLLQNYILGRSDSVSFAQLFAILTSTIGAACSFAGFIDNYARNKKGFKELLMGKGPNSENVRLHPNDQKRKSEDGKKQRNKLGDKLKTVKPNNTAGYNSLVFMGLMVFLYLLPIALLSAQFNLAPVFMLLIHFGPVLYMIATKLFGLKNKEWIYSSLTLIYVAIIVVSTVWYGKVAHGWLGGDSFANRTLTTVAPTQAPTEAPTTSDGGSSLGTTIAGIGFLWSGRLTSFTGSCLPVFLFIVLFASFCFILGVLTCDFTRLPCVVKQSNDADVEKDKPAEPERISLLQQKSVESNPLAKKVEDLRVEMATLNEKVEVLEKRMKDVETGKKIEDVSLA